MKTLCDFKTNRAKNYRVFAWSYRGEYHRQQGMPNQDCVKYFISKHGLFFGVADGVGSCKKAHIGARRILEIAIELLKRPLDHNRIFTAETFIHELIARWKKLYPADKLKEYSTTLKAVFVKDGKLIALSCGDGLLLIYDGEKIIRLGRREENGFVNETCCFNPHICRADVQSVMCKCPRRWALFMCTDGISTALDEKKEDEFMKNVFEQIGKPSFQTDISGLVQEISTYNFDDKTLEVGYYDFTGE